MLQSAHVSEQEAAANNAISHYSTVHRTEHKIMEANSIITHKLHF